MHVVPEPRHPTALTAVLNMPAAPVRAAEVPFPAAGRQMSCEHCAVGIREEVTEVPGVSEVVVDLAADAVTVNGTDLDDERLRAAIVEAGYGSDDSTAA